MTHRRSAASPCGIRYAIGLQAWRGGLAQGNPPWLAGAGCYAARYGVGLVGFGRGGVTVASATAIRVGTRYFLATAGHALEGLEHDEDLHIVPPMAVRDEWLPFVARRMTTDRGPGRADLGWIELQDEVAEAAGLEFLDLGRLQREGERLGWERTRSDRAMGGDPAIYFVHGVPSQLASQRRGRRLHLRALGYTTLGATAVAPGTRVANARDLRLEYDARSLSRRRCGLRHLPDAHGMSGGGVWRVGQAGRPRLVALVRAWHPGERELRGVRIHRWLGVLRQDFPELGTTLDPLLERDGTRGFRKGETTCNDG